MRLVVDASVAVKWLVEEEQSELAESLFDGAHDLHAPRLMVSEVSNALWAKVRRHQIRRDEAEVLATAIAGMPLRWFGDEHICADAVRLALALDRPAYDCTYLALGHRLGATLVTADIRFMDAVKMAGYGGSIMALESFETDMQ